MRRVCSSRASTTRRAGGISTERCPGRHRVLFFAWENSVLKVSKRSNIRWARGLKSGRSPVNEQAIGYRRPRNSSSGIPAWKRIAWSLKALTTFSPVVLGSFIYGVACVQGYGDFNKNRLAESSGYLDMPRDRLLNVCQSFFPGRPLADASREGWHRYGIPSVLVLFHKDRVAETSIGQSIPPVEGCPRHYMGVMPINSRLRAAPCG